MDGMGREIGGKERKREAEKDRRREGEKERRIEGEKELSLIHI